MVPDTVSKIQFNLKLYLFDWNLVSSLRTAMPICRQHWDEGIFCHFRRFWRLNVVFWPKLQKILNYRGDISQYHPGFRHPWLRKTLFLTVLFENEIQSENFFSWVIIIKPWRGQKRHSRARATAEASYRSDSNGWTTRVRQRTTAQCPSVNGVGGQPPTRTMAPMNACKHKRGRCPGAGVIYHPTVSTKFWKTSFLLSYNVERPLILKVLLSWVHCRCIPDTSPFSDPH